MTLAMKLSLTCTKNSLMMLSGAWYQRPLRNSMVAF
ncbi:hypothetical protein [Shigella phage ESh20]|nr:hypothetical protein [Shigella phage ESh20]